MARNANTLASLFSGLGTGIASSLPAVAKAGYQDRMDQRRMAKEWEQTRQLLGEREGTQARFNDISQRDITPGDLAFVSQYLVPGGPERLQTEQQGVGERQGLQRGLADLTRRAEPTMLPGGGSVRPFDVNLPPHPAEENVKRAMGIMSAPRRPAKSAREEAFDMMKDARMAANNAAKTLAIAPGMMSADPRERAMVDAKRQSIYKRTMNQAFASNFYQRFKRQPTPDELQEYLGNDYDPTLFGQPGMPGAGGLPGLVVR